MQLLQVLKDNEYEEYKLCRDDGVWVVSFDVEIRGGGDSPYKLYNSGRI